MFESYVTPLLKRLLNRYLHDVDVDQIPLLGGDIVITNVSLRVDVIQSLIPIPLPFEISGGVVKTLTVRIPWTGLQSSSIQVELNQVEITLQPWETRRRRSSFGSTTSLPSTMSWPDDSSRRPSDASSNTTSSASNVASEESSAAAGGGGESWTMSLLSSLLHNISIDVKNAVFRFETPSCVLSLTVKQLLFTRANDSWQAAYSEPIGASKCSRSLITATDVAVCVDPIVSKRRQFEEPVISRMKVIVRMTQHGMPLVHGSDIDIDTFHVMLSTVSVSLTTEQCSAIIDIATKLASASASNETPTRVNSGTVPPSHTLEANSLHAPSPDKQHVKQPQQASASKKSGWLRSAWMLLQEEDAGGEFNEQGQPIPLIKAPAGSCLRISVSKLSLRLRGPVGIGPSPGAIASTVLECSALEFERTTILDVPPQRTNDDRLDFPHVLNKDSSNKLTCQAQTLLCVGSIMAFGTTGCAVLDCVGSAASAASTPLNAADSDAAGSIFGPLYSPSSGIRPSRDRTTRASSCSAVVFGHRVIWRPVCNDVQDISLTSVERNPVGAVELLLHCSGMNVSLQPQTVSFLQNFLSHVELYPVDDDLAEVWQPNSNAAPKALPAEKDAHHDWISSALQSLFLSLNNQLFWLDIGTCSIILPFVPTPQHPSGCSLVAAMDRLHVASTYPLDLIENDRRDILAEFFASQRVPMSLSINAGSFSLRLEHNTSTEAQQLLLPFSAQCIVMHNVGSSTLHASISSLQVALSERSMRQVQALWVVWLQQLFHSQSSFDHQYHTLSARVSSFSGGAVNGSGSSSTDVRAQMLELQCSSSSSVVELQLSLKAMEASGLVTVVPAPLAPHISEAPKHLFALFGKKVLGTPADTGLEFGGGSCAASISGGWKWKSSIGGCNIELLQHSMAPWVVLQGMSVSYAKMADAAQRIRALDAHRGSPWHLRRSLSQHSSSSSVACSPSQMHDDIAIDILAQPSVETRKENDSLRLLLGSYESHFARMRQQLQQLIPNGLISRDMDVLPFSSSKASSAAFASSSAPAFSFERFCPSVFSRIRKRDTGPGGHVWFRCVRGASNRLLLLIVVYVVCVHVAATWFYLGKSAPLLPSFQLPDVFRKK